MSRITLGACFVAALSFAFPVPASHPRQVSDVVFRVTGFVAFMADPYVDGAQSNLTFHVSDTRPGFEAEADCVIPNTYFNLYAISALFDYCGDRAVDVSYRYTEEGLTVRRGWKMNETTYITGSGTQNSYWSEGGPAPNVTVYPDGKLFTRQEEWLFPVTRLQTSAPP